MSRPRRSLLPALAAAALCGCASSGARKTFPGPLARVYAGFAEQRRQDSTGFSIVQKPRALILRNKLTGARYDFTFHPAKDGASTDVEVVASSPEWDAQAAREAAQDVLDGYGFWLLPEQRAMLRKVDHQQNSQLGSASASAPASVVDEPSYRLPPREDRFAVVVGVEKYQRLPDALFAKNDARAIQRHLAALGFPAQNVLFLADADATSAGIRRYIEEWLPRNLRAGSTLLFYFAGHGAPELESREAYLVPWDGDPQFLRTTALPLRKLYASLAALPARDVLVVLDTCFSGAGGRSVLARGTRPLVTEVRSTAPDTGPISLLAAASGDEITSSLEEAGHGLFTYYLLSGLNGAAAGPAGVTARGLFSYLKPKVVDAASRQNRRQTPVFHAAGARELVLGAP